MVDLMKIELLLEEEIQESGYSMDSISMPGPWPEFRDKVG
jgi:hypothetical protein